MPNLHVLFEDNHLLVINKPAGLVTQGANAGDVSVVTLTQQYLKEKYNKPGNVYIGVVSRLDSLVSGVLVLARTSKAAARLNEQFREHTTEKIYWAVVESESVPVTGECHDYLRKDESQQKVVVTSKSHSEAQFAHLRFRKLQTWAGKSLLEVELITGRKHQIRVQLASRNWPIVGDAKYLARSPFSSGIALHARSLRILHPTLKTPLHFTAPLPSSWNHFSLSKND